MGIWTLIQFDKEKLLSGPPTFRDLTVVSIGMLMLAYWQFQDPYLPSTFSGLTLVEVGKAVAWWLFSLTFFRCGDQRDRKILLLGVAAGLFTYAGATALGSLIHQGPGGGRGNIYNVWDGSNLAGSVICGYAASGALLIISRLKKRLFISAAILTAAVGLQSGARTPMLVFLCITVYFIAESAINKRGGWGQYLRLAAITASGLAVIQKSGILEMTALSRFSKVAEPVGRTLLYPEGYRRLTRALIDNDPSTLGDPLSFASEQWWHHILLDSYRNAGLAGLVFAAAWAINLASTALTSLLSKDYLLTLISALSSFLLLTGLPLGTGSYELVSVLALTLLCNLRLSELQPRLAGSNADE